jgi:predicted AlkP superfamily pyrophosphatase or phosphodiesterase
MTKEQAKRHVIVISLDAMITTDLAVLKTLSRCKELFSRYSQVDEVLCTFPTLTYPCHATIMTGCVPAKHGIIHNEVFAPEAKTVAWNLEERNIHVSTMPRIAHENGLRTASISWPTMMGAPIDFLIPEIWPPKERQEQEDAYQKNVSLSAQPFFQRHRHLLHTYAGRDLDAFSTACAVDIINTDFPDLMFLHLAALDCSRHNRGVATEKNLDALNFLDQQIGEILDAVRSTGHRQDTDVVILSDHGQLDCRRVFNINRVLKDSGYITVDDRGLIDSWRIYCHTGALSAFVYVQDIPLNEVKRVLSEIKTDFPGTIDRIFTQFELEKLYDCTGPFSFAVEAMEGTYLNGNVSATAAITEITPGSFSDASHGQAPERGPKPPFVICSPRSTGIMIPQANLVDEAPTIMNLLGLEMPSCDGRILPMCQ